MLHDLEPQHSRHNSEAEGRLDAILSSAKVLLPRIGEKASPALLQRLSRAQAGSATGAAAGIVAESSHAAVSKVPLAAATRAALTSASRVLAWPRRVPSHERAGHPSAALATQAIAAADWMMHEARDAQPGGGAVYIRLRQAMASLQSGRFGGPEVWARLAQAAIVHGEHEAAAECAAAVIRSPLGCDGRAAAGACLRLCVADRRE